MRGSGNVITERREVSGYHAVDLSGVGELVIDQNGSEGLTIEAEDNILPLIRSEVQDGTLLIGPNGDTTFTPTRPLKFNLSVRTLEGIGVSGAGMVRSANLNAPSLQLTVSGAGGLNLDALSGGELWVDISGSGYITASGKVSSEEVGISGTGAFTAGELASSTATVSISGAGAATVWVSETLDASVSGVGSVRYKGNPRVSRDVSGIGSISRL